MSFVLRPFHPSDLYSVYLICNQGNIDNDPELLGHYYAAPYAVFEPDLCFIMTHEDKPCGYILGTRDSEVFWTRCEREWFPLLRKRYPLRPPEDKSGDAGQIKRMHNVRKADPAMHEYPAHLHIQLLPFAQGKRLGNLMMDAFIGRLEELGVTGLHLGTNTGNTRAVAFYDRMGFKRLDDHPTSVTFGMRLPRAR